MKLFFVILLVVLLCVLFVACENTSDGDNDTTSLNTTTENTLQEDNGTNQADEPNETDEPNQQSDTESLPDMESLPDYTAQDEKSEDEGTITVDLNGKSKTFTTPIAFDNNIGSAGTWSNIFGSSDTIYIQLPSDVQTGDEFTVEDGTMSVNSFGPPDFSFVYTDKAGNDYAIYDVNNIFDSFGLIIDKWDGRGGYVEGRFVAEIRPLVGDTIIMEDARFKVKIRD